MAEKTITPVPARKAETDDGPNIPLFSRPEGGIWLTLAAVAVFEFLSHKLFVIPPPSSIYCVVVAAATTLGGMRIGLVSALLVIIASVLAMSEPGHLFHFAPEATVRIAIFCLTAPATAVIVGGLRRRNERLARERTERALAEERAVAALARERRIVEALQNNLLSRPATDAFPGLAVAMRYEAASDEAEVGGDFFDAFTMADGRVALLVGDISGKGLAAASRTAASKYTLRTLLRDCTDPGAAVAQANRFLVQDLERADRETSPYALPSFACLSLAVIRPESGEMEVVVAGMDPPVIVRADTGQAEIFEAEGMPLGINDAATYRPLRQSLGHGDLLVFATDGITEARDATRLQFFGVSGLRSAAECAARLDSLDEATLSLLNAAKRFTPKGSLNDDACLLLARRL